MFLSLGKSSACDARSRVGLLLRVSKDVGAFCTGTVILHNLGSRALAEASHVHEMLPDFVLAGQAHGCRSERPESDCHGHGHHRHDRGGSGIL